MLALGGAVDAVRLEVRRLEQDGRGRLADLGLLAAHDPGERDGALGVGDHEVVGGERARDAVERRQLLARPGAPDDDLARRAASAKSKACSGLPSASMT